MTSRCDSQPNLRQTRVLCVIGEDEQPVHHGRLRVMLLGSEQEMKPIHTAFVAGQHGSAFTTLLPIKEVCYRKLGLRCWVLVTAPAEHGRVRSRRASLSSGCFARPAGDTTGRRSGPPRSRLAHLACRVRLIYLYLALAGGVMSREERRRKNLGG